MINTLNKKSKKQRILEHLINEGFINSLIAFKKYGETRLSDKVYQLRNEGYEIISQPAKGLDRYGNITFYVNYILKQKKSDTENIELGVN